MRIVGVGSEGDKSASDERGGDGEAVRDDFEETGEPEVPEKLSERIVSKDGRRERRGGETNEPYRKVPSPSRPSSFRPFS